MFSHPHREKTFFVVLFSDALLLTRVLREGEYGDETVAVRSLRASVTYTG